MASKHPYLDQTSSQNKKRESDENAEESYSEIHLKGVNYVISLWIKHIDNSMDKIRDCVRGIKIFSVTDYFNEKNINEIITILEMNDNCKEIFKCIMRKLAYQIHQFIGTFFYLEINTKALRDFLTHLKFTSEITINHKKTALHLVKKTGLSTEDKYKLSCYFCLEENVKKLGKLLNKHFIKQMCSSTKESLHILALCYHCSLNDTKSLKETIKAFKEEEEEEDYHCDPLMLWAIGRRNKVAVEYIFEKFVKDKCEDELSKYLRDALYYKFANVVSYLFSKITDKEKLDMIYLNENYILLSVIASDCRLRNLFKRIEEDILKHISKMNKTDTIKTLIQCWILNESKREEYKKYFQDFELKFRHKLNEDLLKSDNLLILKAILEVKHVNILLKVGSISDVKMLHIDKIKLIGEQLILDNKSQIFDELMQAAYDYKEDELKTFKCLFFEKSNHNICSKLLLDFRYRELDNYFLAYCEPEKMNLFKEKILTKYRLILGDVMLSAIEKGCSVEDCGNKTLRWCFNGNEEKMELCKKELFDQKSETYPYSKKKFLIVVNEIEEDEIYDLNKFLDWAYPGSSNDFKKKIIKMAALLNKKK